MYERLAALQPVILAGHTVLAWVIIRYSPNLVIKL